MDFDQVFRWILSHPSNYPGKHLESQPRTNQSYKALEPVAQFHLILKATKEYIQENITSGKGVNVRGFGAFTFEVFSSKVKPAQQVAFDLTKELNDQREERKHVHQIRPCFVPDIRLKNVLDRYPGKEELQAPASQHSIYQKGFAMIFCNAGPIGQACFLSKEVVTSAHEAFFRAIVDLAQLNHSLNLAFGFCSITITRKDLKYTYKAGIVDQLNVAPFENKMRKSTVPTASIWRSTSNERWQKSGLNTLFKRPNSPLVRSNNEKTLALKILSLDLNTADKTEVSKNSGGMTVQIAAKK
jgi:nucleoid DNA-binding protein